MDDDEGVDLFEDYEDQPEEVSELLSTLEVEDYNYDSLNDLLSEMKKIGYTFEFGLDAEPYDLRKIGQKGKSEFYAEGGELKGDELENVRKDAKMASKLNKSTVYVIADKQYNYTTKRPYWQFTWATQEDYEYMKEHTYPNNYISVEVMMRYENGELKSTNKEVIFKNDNYAEGGKLDESTKMVLSQNKAIAHHTEELKRALQKDPNVEPWVIGKVGRAETDISDVTHYLDGRSEYARGGVMRKRKMTLYESKLMAENGKRVLVSHDAQQFYTIEDGVLYKTDDDLNHQKKFDMDKIDLTIKPMESYGGKYARGGKTKLMLNYVSPRDISLLKITTDDGVKHSIKGESIISGEYKLARGGKLSDNYVYIPKRNIDQVILKDGKTTDDKFNGFYVKKNH